MSAVVPHDALPPCFGSARGARLRRSGTDRTGPPQQTHLRRLRPRGRAEVPAGTAALQPRQRPTALPSRAHHCPSWPLNPVPPLALRLLPANGAAVPCVTPGVANGRQTGGTTARALFKLPFLFGTHRTGGISRGRTALDRAARRDGRLGQPMVVQGGPAGATCGVRAVPHTEPSLSPPEPPCSRAPRPTRPSRAPGY